MANRKQTFFIGLCCISGFILLGYVMGFDFLKAGAMILYVLGACILAFAVLIGIEMIYDYLGDKK